MFNSCHSWHGKSELAAWPWRICIGDRLSPSCSLSTKQWNYKTWLCPNTVTFCGLVITSVHSVNRMCTLCVNLFILLKDVLIFFIQKQCNFSNTFFCVTILWNFLLTPYLRILCGRDFLSQPNKISNQCTTISTTIGFFTNFPQYKNANIVIFFLTVPSERNWTNEVCNL